MALLNIRPGTKVKFANNTKIKIFSGYGYGSGGGEESNSLLSGLQAFYKLSDTSDSSGNGNTLTNNGGVTFSSGKIENAASFNNSSWLSQSSLMFSDKTEVSINLWIKGPNQSGPKNAFSTGSTGGNNRGYGIYADTNNGLYMLPWNNSSLGYAHAFVPNQWFHVVSTFLRDGSTTTVKHYVDGSLQATRSASNVWFPSSIGNGILIGRSNEGQQFGGLVDAVGVWDRALTSGEVSSLYNSGAGIEL